MSEAEILECEGAIEFLLEWAQEIPTSDRASIENFKEASKALGMCIVKAKGILLELKEIKSKVEVEVLTKSKEIEGQKAQLEKNIEVLNVLNVDKNNSKIERTQSGINGQGDTQIPITNVEQKVKESGKKRPCEQQASASRKCQRIGSDWQEYMDYVFKVFDLVMPISNLSPYQNFAILTKGLLSNEASTKNLLAFVANDRPSTCLYTICRNDDKGCFCEKSCLLATVVDGKIKLSVKDL